MIASINCPVCNEKLDIYIAAEYFNSYCHKYRHYIFIVDWLEPAREMTRFKINDDIIVVASTINIGTDIYYMVNPSKSQSQLKICSFNEYMLPSINLIKRLLNINSFL